MPLRAPQTHDPPPSLPPTPVEEVRYANRRKVYARAFPAAHEAAARSTLAAKASGPTAAVRETLKFETTGADEELVVQVFEPALLGPDVLVGAARVSLWAAITEGPQALSARLAPPRGAAGGAPAGEVVLRLAFELRRRPQQAAPAHGAATAAPVWLQPPQAQEQQRALHQQKQPDAAGTPGWLGQPAPCPQPAMGYPAVGAVAAPEWGAQAAFNPWGQAPAGPDHARGAPQPGAATGAALAASPYPQDPTTFAYPARGAAAAGQRPAGGQYAALQQQLPPPQQQYPQAPYASGYPQQAPPHGAQQLPPHAQQLPTMPVMYSQNGRPQGGGGGGLPALLGGGGGGGGSKPGGASGVGLGGAILGGVAAALALDAIF